MGMNCEQFGQQACDENRRTADRIGLMLDQDDPRTAADVIRQELYDRPGPLAIDLLQRIRQYDEPGVGADLKIQPMVRQVPAPGGGVDWIDTGDRSVVVDSEQYGRDQVAIIKGASEQPYPRYPDGRYIESNRFDPFAMITSMFVGHLLNGQFSRWQNRPHFRQNWMDSQGGWYPQNDGQWGRQYRDYPYHDDSSYRRFFDRNQQYRQRNPNFWQGQQQPWRQGQDPRWGQQEQRYDQSQSWRQQQQQQNWLLQQRLRQQQGPDNRQAPGFGDRQPPFWQHPRLDDGRRPRYEIPPRQERPDNRRDGRQDQPRFDRRPEQPPVPRREQPPAQRFDQSPRQEWRQPQQHRDIPRLQPQPQPHREMPRQQQPHRENQRVQPQEQQPRGDRRQGR